MRFMSYWPALLLVGFASAFIPLVPLLGYRWSVELALGVFLLTAACGYLFHLSSTEPPTSIYELDFSLISLPLILFTSWSFLSALWANSPRAAVHHSLLWACYVTFYLFVKQAAEDDEIRNRMLKILGVVAFAISTACVVEYFAVDDVAKRSFNERYYSYAEAFVALIPVFIALKFETDRKHSRFALVVASMLWAMVIATTARTMLIAGFIGIGVFVVFAQIVHRHFERPRRLVLTLTTLLAITLLLQIPFRSSEQPSTFTRLAQADESSALSTQSRRVMWGLAIEGFLHSPILGIGGENYFADYKTLRESFSARDPNNPLLEVGEELIPERAHNEYLQILAELGIVGALLFGWLLVGIAYMFLLAFKRKASLLTIGALSGIAAFLVASGASSYSFRFPTNGICFLFLLAIASRELFARTSDETATVSRITKAVPIFGIVVSVAMIAFCLIRASSISHMTNAINARDEATKMVEIEKAIAIDPSEPIFRFHSGEWLARSGQTEAAIPELRLAIDNGLANSTSYFMLAATQQRIGWEREAHETFEEALRVYPRSVFLRTAYASFLKRIGRTAEAEEQYQKALIMNEKQARSWQLAHDKGLERLVQVSRVDPNYLSPFELLPDQAPLALANAQ